MINKLISVSLDVSKSYTEFESTLTYKLFIELANYYNVKYFINVDANSCTRDYYNEPYYFVNRISYYNKPKIVRLFFLFLIYYKNIKNIKREKANLVFLGVTSSISDCFIFLYKLLCPKQIFYVQLYTPSVNKSRLVRDILDKLLSYNLKFFNHIGAGQQGNLNCVRYNIPQSKNLEVEIGMPDYGYQDRTFFDLNFLYVGTLNGRDVWKTIQPFDEFMSNHQDRNIKFHIVGGGKDSEVNLILSLIAQCKNKSNFTYHGRLSVKDLKEQFANCNIGVSFVPNNDFWQNSSTKTIEYLLSGMPVISTKGFFMSDVISQPTGVLCEDNSEDFLRALEKLYVNVEDNIYDSKYIRSLNEKYSISSVVERKFVPLIDSIL